MSHPNLNDMLKPYEADRQIMLDFCDYTEARLLQHTGPLDDLTRRQLASFQNSVREPAIIDLGGGPKVAFGGFPGYDGLAMMGSIGLIGMSRLNAGNEMSPESALVDLLESSPLIEQVETLIAKHDFNTWLQTRREIDRLMGTPDLASRAVAGKHLMARAPHQPEMRQEWMAAYLSEVADLSAGQVAGPTPWDAFDPREVLLGFARKSDAPGMEVWLQYGNRSLSGAQGDTPRVGPFPCRGEAGEELEQVEYIRTWFYHGLPRAGLDPLSRATAHSLEGRVRDGLTQMLDARSSSDPQTRAKVESLADRFYAYVGEPMSMPSRQVRSMAAPGA